MVVTQYRFRDSAARTKIKDPAKADFPALGKAIERLLKRHDDDVESAAIRLTKIARRTTYPAHRHLEWDDAVCGPLHRLEQARAIISCLEVVITGRPPERLAVNVVTAKGRDYYKVSDIRTNSDLQSSLLQQADRELAQFMARYSFLIDVCELIDAARQKLAAQRGQLDIEQTREKAAL